MNKKLLFIYNPRSGKGKIRSKLVDILDVFTKAGFDTIVHPTQSAGDAGQVIERLAGSVDRVICSGGDGTLDEVASAVMRMGQEIPVGYIPSGSTNDFAHSLNIPKNLVKAARSAAVGEVTSCDIGSLNGEIFVYVAAFGLFTDVAYKTNQTLKNVLGYFAYLLEAGKRIFKIPKYKVRAEADGRVIEDTFSYGMITNARSVGGIKNITGKHVDMRDGLLEVMLVHTPRNPIEFSEILTALLSGKGEKSKYVECFKASELHLTMNREVEWTLDGEYGGAHREVEIRALHNQLKFYLDV